MWFQREVENQLVVLSFQPIVLHVVVFEKDLKLFDFGWLFVKPIQSVVSKNQPIVFWKSLTKFFKFVKFVLIDSKPIWLLH